MLAVTSCVLLFGAGLVLFWLHRRLRESEQRYRDLVERGLGLICSHDLEGRLLSINAAAAQAAGYRPEELVGRAIRELLAPGAQPLFDQYLERIRCTGEDAGFMRIVTRDGEERIWLYRNLRYQDRVVGHAQDVTELHRAKRELKKTQQELEQRVAERTTELRASEQTFRSLSACSPIGIILTDVAGRCTYTNPRLQTITGYSFDQMLGDGWAQCADPDDREWVGERRREAVRERRGFHAEYRMRRPEGEVVWVRDGSAPMVDDQGRVIGHVGTVEDITERRAIEEQLRQAQKMEAVGRLAGGVAHDFNNVLTAVIGYSELLLEELEAASGLRREVEEIRKAAQRAASLTRQLLALGRRQIVEPQVLDLNAVLTNLDQMLRRVIGEDMDLRTLPGRGLRPVKADPGQIEQVILNLAINARDAMPGGGRLTLETANAKLEEGYARLHPGVQPGPYVLLAVSDTGMGMDAETRARIFEPFFTTKALGKGTGLGLAMVYGIVEQAGGHVGVASEVGRGTTFRIYLPPAAAAGETEPHAEPVEAPARGSETILLVEDEEPVRALVRKILHRDGYTILEARQGQEALELAARHSGPIHLLLTDVVMPGMSGVELFRKLSDERPETRVLYMSGYADRPGSPLVQKPFTREELIRRVRAVLEEPRCGRIGA